MSSSHYKVQTYLPESHVKTLQDKLNNVITPIFPEYDYVFGVTIMQGFWRPLDGSNAFQGEIGKIEKSQEAKLEFTIQKKDLEVVFQTIKKHHPYEKPVIEAFAVILASS